MATTTKDGKQHFGNRMKANRYDRAHADDKPEPKGGDRAQANAMEAKTPPHEGGGGDHEEIKNVVAEHGPAKEVHMMHDHAGQKSMVHSMHEDGHQQPSEHMGEGHVHHAHEHAMHAAGVSPEQAEEEKEGEYPEEHKSPTAGGEEDEYSPEEL